MILYDSLYDYCTVVVIVMVLLLLCCYYGDYLGGDLSMYWHRPTQARDSILLDVTTVLAEGALLIACTLAM